MGGAQLFFFCAYSASYCNFPRTDNMLYGPMDSSSLYCEATKRHAERTFFYASALKSDILLELGPLFSSEWVSDVQPNFFFIPCPLCSVLRAWDRVLRLNSGPFSLPEVGDVIALGFKSFKVVRFIMQPPHCLIMSGFHKVTVLMVFWDCLWMIGLFYS